MGGVLFSQPAPVALFSQPWRSMPESNGENLDYVKSYRTQRNKVKHLRILLHGPVGGGKSSFINSVDSVVQGRVTGRALTDGMCGDRFTRAYTTFKFCKSPESFYSLVFTDIMGFENNINMGVHQEDVILALRGHVREGYQFKPGQPMREGDPGYNPDPTPEDKVHVLVSVVSAGSLTLLSDELVNKMRDVRLAASEMGIPQFAILTKVDEACPEAEENISNVYRSKYLKQQAVQFSWRLGLPLNCVFLVKNYESETSANEGIDMLILDALRQMISYGEDFLNNP